jgi:hypothetical protein
MSENSREASAQDELLDKLDRFMQRHRPTDELFPTLESATTPADDVPTLTDIVALPRETAKSDETAENRLINAIGREISRLQAEMPDRTQQLGVLKSTLNAAIRLLARRHLNPGAEGDK